MTLPSFFFTVLCATVVNECNSATIYTAVADIASSVDSGISGTVEFNQDFGSDCVHVEATLYGLPDGQHGFHVHQYGDLTSDIDKSSLGAHFVPFVVVIIILMSLSYNM